MGTRSWRTELQGRGELAAGARAGGVAEGGSLWPSLNLRLRRSCNLTCPPGLHGVDCAQTCSCHEDSCDPVTGACRLGELVSGASGCEVCRQWGGRGGEVAGTPP